MDNSRPRLPAEYEPNTISSLGVMEHVVNSPFQQVHSPAVELSTYSNLKTSSNFTLPSGGAYVEPSALSSNHGFSSASCSHHSYPPETWSLSTETLTFSYTSIYTSEIYQQYGVLVYPSSYKFQTPQFAAAYGGNGSIAVSPSPLPSSGMAVDACGPMTIHYHHTKTSINIHNRGEIDQRPAEAFMNSDHMGVRPSSRYSSVKVLLIHWEDDGDLPGCRAEVYQLESMFRVNFGFHTTVFAIPKRDASGKTIQSVQKFFNCSGSDELRILYYARHGTADPFHLSDSSSARISIPWLPIQEIVHASKSNVLLLLDCCHAMASIPCRGTKILIGASEKHGMAAKPGRFSFTLILLQALKKLTNEFRVGVAVTNLQKYIKYKMELDPNPWFHQQPQIFTFSGYQDLWVERIS